MRSLKVIALSVIAILITFAVAGARPLRQEAKDSQPGSVAGRVTLGGKAARGVTVMLIPSIPESQMNMMKLFEQKSVSRATTDEEGGYRFAGVPAGRYRVAPFAPALVAAGESNGRTVNIGSGESLDKIDFALTRGGVITGRVMDSDGKPAVAEPVKVSPVDPPNRPQGAAETGISIPDTKLMTDDRGIYRIYGLAAGRYLVSVGAPGQTSAVPNVRARYNAETFHPGITDKSKATIIELSEGGEVTGVDIRLGLPSRTFKASGRIIDSTNGKPIAGIMANYGSTGPDQKEANVMSLGSMTNSKGEFKLDALVPGSYVAYAMPDENSELYSDLTAFEVKDADVTGIEIKVRRGTSISGVVTVEGTDDPAILASLSELQLVAVTREPERTAPRYTSARIGGDGSFRLQGLQPGKVKIELNRFFTPTKLDLLRVERNGVPQIDGLPVVQGESISDVRVVLAYAGATLRGQIKAADGLLPEDLNLDVTAVRAGSFGGDRRADVDANGRFIIEGLLPGTYEVTLIAARPGAEPAPAVKQTVIVTNENESFITLTLDLKAKK